MSGASIMKLPWAFAVYSAKRFGIGTRGSGAAYFLQCINTDAADRRSKSDVKHLVHCVNEHENLIKALQYARRFMRPDADLNYVDTAIAKGKG